MNLISRSASLDHTGGDVPKVEKKVLKKIPALKKYSKKEMPSKKYSKNEHKRNSVKKVLKK